MKSVYEKELMVIVLAMQKWQPYLLGRKFLVRTYLLEQRIISLDYQKWMLKLLGYDFDIHYYLGPSSMVADAISRLPIEVAVIAMTTTQWLDHHPGLGHI